MSPLPVAEVSAAPFGRVPERSTQCRQLEAAIALAYSTPTPPPMILQGPSGAGKSHVIDHFFRRDSDSVGHTFAFLSCVERYTQRLLFESALNQITATVPSAHNGFANYAKCDSIVEFVAQLKEIAAKSEKPFFLIFDSAERLRAMSPTLVPALLKLSEVTRCRISVIMITTLLWDQFLTDRTPQQPILIQFPNYTKGELFSIVKQDCPPGEESWFFGNFCSLIFDVFHEGCKDLNELRHLIALLFPKYLEPVQSGKVKKNETSKLYVRIQPTLKEALEKLYLREMSSAEWMQHVREQKETMTISTRTNLELPYYTRFLLIASYLASYNPAKMDVRFFYKGVEERRKVTKRGKSKTGGLMRQQLLGPKAFPIERMLAIFYSIIEDPIDSKIDIQTQISTLITLKLLRRVSSLDQLDDMKCKCNVTFEVIQQVAQAVRFDISKYLYDFV
ncbi:origin recognition complex subunit 5 C-terminus-domain-containing protein [Polychytrium aggregatum]|uniref:origin recognition complex subunit 5 C-terminus-domain-containing protein n=1 Tax=Polychytrium aggregatum TaxID=110093 RepID=UPI0022FE9E9B|nr:origin recognition complex subunit 5 C-terminus-domain-containing protein [Polychytrium aggregatum]KAI9207559.1 origin recognition complex subunit 5 C-terminus-domain-containing protein [Polychytrium aggregatum]